MTLAKLSRILSGRTVLVTGGGGTIGSEICRQVAERKPARIVCLGWREEKLIAVRDELRQWHPDVEVATELCDVRNLDRLDAVFNTHRPNIVFHAAAKNDILYAEAYPAEAVMVNVQGTINVVDVALANHSETLLFTSSTQAFRPVSVMGSTKRLGEIIVDAAVRSADQSFFTVRLRNVLESSGGVHAIFRRQIESGGPVTVTHPDAERIFVTAAETVGLLLDVLVLRPQGGILSLAAGETTNITKLARRLISSYGLQVGRDIDIEYIGLRSGERLVEETTCDETVWLSTAHDKILVSGLNGAFVPDPGFDRSLQELLLVVKKGGDTGAVLEQLRKMVSDYSPAAR